MEKEVNNFKILIEQDEEGWYVATAPHIHGCYTQGKTIQEAIDRIKEAIGVCLEADGEKVELMKSRSIQQDSRDIAIMELYHVSGGEMCRILENLGFEKIYAKGNYIRFKHPDGRKIVVPIHMVEVLRHVCMGFPDIATIRDHSTEDLRNGLLGKILKQIRLGKKNYKTLWRQYRELDFC